jgi:hypothetical protein
MGEAADVVGMVAAIDPIKRPDIFVRAAALLARARPERGLSVGQSMPLVEWGVSRFIPSIRSLYGAIMGAKKLATKYLKIPLVPASIATRATLPSLPSLAASARRLRATGAWSAEVRIAPDRKKRVLRCRQRPGSRYGRCEADGVVRALHGLAQRVHSFDEPHGLADLPLDDDDAAAAFRPECLDHLIHGRCRFDETEPRLEPGRVQEFVSYDDRQR